MSTPFPFPQVARVPAPGDNVAIAIRRLDAGTLVSHDGRELRLPHTVLEGHRFALKPIAVGEPLLSWGLPFGEAVRPIHPGDYVCNESIIAALRQRHVNFPLPEYGNFQNKFAPVRLDEQTFQPGKEVEKYPDPATFEGFARDPQRGAGTRNYIAILGTTSLTASYSRALADRFKAVAKEFPNIDGVVAIAHTEGGGSTRPNNFDFTVRTLAGMMVNPSIGAVLAVDFGAEVITNETLREFMRVNSYPTENLLHRFLSLEGSFEESLAEGEKIVRAWLDPVNAFHRTPQPLANLRIGLQCGGSDAFSGISGNPLVGWLSHELVRHGGSANLAETDELIGAEPYILANVRDYATARAFLAQLKRFQDRAGWHGSSAEGNPSGGNMFRGLYNIAIKSIGAARKKDPATRLDYVIDYGQRMTGPGFYFMDSPGNDLESIAGQVAAGCNLIVFTTGNGSITNFPFVPTIKVMTNTGRFNLLRREMDFNAGRYLDGEPMEELGREIFDYARSVASGRRSAGEQAGHSQVQLWREWRQTDSSRLEELLHAPKPDGQPLPLKPSFRPDLYAGMFQFDVWRGEYGPATERVGLIVPTSLCSSQIARLIADKLNHAIPGTSAGASHRYVA
ncbi:MAG TPA: UxaA family hydrolase, partial [Verrucomicrobiae bacterium]|nr:UxaA family hydrolase [Verrucomicrobiae bacterium]